MSTIRSKNTAPELILRKALWLTGLRYRIHYGKEKIDIAFPSDKIAVFVDGCFWHGCPFHSHIPKSNIEYWKPKLEKNIQRDKDKNERLRSAGWTVIRFWEHEMKNVSPILEKINTALTGKRVNNSTECK
jgi:DNA mismatch endonuclease, patch repair protein